MRNHSLANFTPYDKKRHLEIYQGTKGCDAPSFGVASDLNDFYASADYETVPRLVTPHEALLM